MQCPTCDGDGEIDFPFGEGPATCFKCEGDGSIPLSEWVRWQWPQYRHYVLCECPACDGEGVLSEWAPGVPDARPIYDCDYCDGEPLITPWRWLKWHYWIASPPAPLWKIKQVLIWWNHGEWVT